MEVVSFPKRKRIHHLLCSAPNLKELSSVADHKTAFGDWMDVLDIVKSEWVYEGLEVFACGIGGIPRPDIMRGGSNQFGSPEESVDLQRQVYSKLARFMKLRELRLGWPLDTKAPSYCQWDKEIYRQRTCLAMTLDSGLDLWKNLKHLRVVGLEGMAVYIGGDKEQTWVAEHWPHVVIGTEG